MSESINGLKKATQCPTPRNPLQCWAPFCDFLLKIKIDFQDKIFIAANYNSLDWQLLQTVPIPPAAGPTFHIHHQESQFPPDPSYSSIIFSVLKTIHFEESLFPQYPALNVSSSVCSFVKKRVLEGLRNHKKNQPLLRI